MRLTSAWRAVIALTLVAACGEPKNDETRLDSSLDDIGLDSTPQMDSESVESSTATDTATESSVDTDAEVLEAPSINGIYEDGEALVRVSSNKIEIESPTAISRFTIVKTSNPERYGIAKNDDGNSEAGGLWSRFDWTEFNGNVYLCHAATAAESAEAALATAPANQGDLAAGCKGGPWSRLKGLSIAGEYSEAFGTHTIARSTWMNVAAFNGSVSLYHIVRFSNAGNYLVAGNDAANAYNAGAWSRFEWALQDGTLYYCQTVYDAASEDDAADFTAHAAARRDDLTGTGCGGFPWTRLSQLEVVGDYSEAYGGHTVSEFLWRDSVAESESLFHITRYSNAEDYLIAKNDAANAYNAGAWSRFEWALRDGALYYCQTVYDAASKDDAADFTAHAGARRDDLTGAGCGGFPWTALSTLAIEGAYNEAYGWHELSERLWRNVSSFDGAESRYHIARYSNTQGYLIAENDVANTYNPGAWSRFEWTLQDGTLYYCQTVYDAASADDAADFTAHAGARRDDLEAAGCGGFPWSVLRPME